MYTVRNYNSTCYQIWNDFVEKSKNGTFLFHRDFMEYHCDRFEDYSLMIFEGSKLVALFPANKVGDELWSHQGLTYGGLLLDGNPGGEKVKEMMRALFSHLKNQRIVGIFIKQIPSFYFKEATFESDYFLLKAGATLYRRDMNLAIDYSKPLAISKAKMKRFKQPRNEELQIKADNNFDIFWDNVLVPRLAEKHNATPVHSKEEIKLLHSRFPNSIIQYNVYREGQPLAGITLFDFGNVVKSQYGATTAAGEEARALDYLFIKLIEKYQQSAQYFDMGVVTDGEGYNSGLLKQKEEFGCGIHLQDYYKISLQSL